MAKLLGTRRVSVQAKLLAMTSLIIALMAVVGVLAITGLGSVNSASAKIHNGYLGPAVDLRTAQVYYNENRTNLRDLILKTAAADRSKLTGELSDNAATIDKLLAGVHSAAASPALKSSVAGLQKKMAAYAPVRKRYIADVLAGHDAAAQALSVQYLTLIESIATNFDSANAIAAKAATPAGQHPIDLQLPAHADHRRARWRRSFSAVALSWWIARGIRKGIGQVLSRMRNLDEHCLSRTRGRPRNRWPPATSPSMRLPTPPDREVLPNDEVGDLAHTFNQDARKDQALDRQLQRRCGRSWRP